MTFPPTIPAVKAPAHYGTSEMLGNPGMYRTWISLHGTDTVDRMDVCCPGCGQTCWRLDQTTHPMVGGNIREFQVHPSICCGWRGRMRNGQWETLPAGGGAGGGDDADGHAGGR